MSKSSCRELLDAIKKHEEFLEVTDWTREPDNLTFALAARVEKVLAFCAESKATFSPDLEHSDPVVRALARGRVSAAEQVLRRLDGEEP